jgi:hypothetical protein
MDLTEEMHQYLQDIGITETVMFRVQQALFIVSDLLPTDTSIERIFISESVDGAGLKIYEGAWVFGGQRAYEVHSFAIDKGSQSVDCVPLSVAYWRLDKQSFDAGSSTPLSRMSLQCQFGPASLAGGVMKASGKNCEYLYRTLKDFIIPNVRT